MFGLSAIIPVTTRSLPPNGFRSFRSLKSIRVILRTFFAKTLCVTSLPPTLLELVVHSCGRERRRLETLDSRLRPRPSKPASAEALDELFSDLDAGVAALERAREEAEALPRFGAQSGGRGGADRQLARGASRRRARERVVETHSHRASPALGGRSAPQFRGEGKPPPKNWRGEVQGTRWPDTAGLPTLPEGWCWATVDQLAWSASYGTSVKCREDNRGPAVLRIPNIVDGRISLADLKFAPDGHTEPNREIISSGDLLVVRTNGSKNLIGRGAVIVENTQIPLLFASYLIRFRLVECKTILHWVSLIWNSFLLRNWIEKNAATSAGQYNISLRLLNTLTIPLPPSAEQKVIFEAVEDQLSIVDHLETNLDAKLKAAQSLRQAILRHAFSGKLFATGSERRARIRTVKAYCG